MNLWYVHVLHTQNQANAALPCVDVHQFFAIINH